MNDSRVPHNLQELLDRIEEAACGREEVSLETVMEMLGRRSYGPLLLLAGLVTLAPVIGDIPGVPTIMALLVLLIGIQVVLGRDRLWLPDWLLRRSVHREKLKKVLRWSRRPARFVDRLLKPRLTALTHGAGSYAVAVLCTVIAIAMPVTEVVPFSANGVGLVLTAFGLSLIAHDGLMALLALLFTTATAGVLVYALVL